MSRVVWPFEPLDNHVEILEWITDVFQAKSQEQRISIRPVPRRFFHFEHVLTDYELAAARATVRDVQAADGYLVPDWPQAIYIGAISSGSDVSLGNDPDYQEIGIKAILYESPAKYEQVTITLDSTGFSADTVTDNYSSAYVVPLWNGVSIDGLTAERIGANLNRAQITLLITENNDLGGSDYSQYRSLDVVPSCPVVVGRLEDKIGWPHSLFDNDQSIPYLLRSRDIPSYMFDMRWHVFTDQDKWTLRKWLYSRRGRQKAFFLSSFSKDFEPAASVSGTTLTVYALPGVYGIGHTDPFDIDLKAAGANYYRRVTSATAGSPIGGRDTLDLTLDSSITASLEDIQRISFLRCARFATDRFELLHRAEGGTMVKAACMEIIEP